MDESAAPLAELCRRIEATARSDMRTPIDGLLLSRVETATPDHSLTEPLLVVMAQGAKRILLGEKVFEYHAGQCLVVTADLPVTGHFIDASTRTPALGVGLRLRADRIAPLLLQKPAETWGRSRTGNPATVTTGRAGPALLDAVVRMVRLIDHPSDAPVLAPLIEQEILWRLLTGPHSDAVRQIGLPDSDLTHINHAIRWIRGNYAEPVRIADLAGMAGMSTSTFHRRFRAITAMSPLQFQKSIRLQEARTLLLSDVGDVTGVAHLVGYDSPTQFNREYRRMFGAPPGQDAKRLRSLGLAHEGPYLP